MARKSAFLVPLGIAGALLIGDYADIGTKIRSLYETAPSRTKAYVEEDPSKIPPEFIKKHTDYWINISLTNKTLGMPNIPIDIRRGPGYNFPVIGKEGTFFPLEIISHTVNPEGETWLQVNYGDNNPAWTNANSVYIINRDDVPTYYRNLALINSLTSSYPEAVKAWKIYTTRALLNGDTQPYSNAVWGWYRNAVEQLPEDIGAIEMKVALAAYGSHSLKEYEERLHNADIDELLQVDPLLDVDFIRRSYQPQMIADQVRKVLDSGRQPEEKFSDIMRITLNMDHDIVNTAFNMVNVRIPQTGEQTTLGRYINIMARATETLAPGQKELINAQTREALRRFDRDFGSNISSTPFAQDPFGTAVYILTGEKQVTDVINESLFAQRGFSYSQYPQRRQNDSMVTEGVFVDRYTGEPVE